MTTQRVWPCRAAYLPPTRRRANWWARSGLGGTQTTPPTQRGWAVTPTRPLPPLSA